MKVLKEEKTNGILNIGQLLVDQKNSLIDRGQVMLAELNPSSNQTKMVFHPWKKWLENQ